MDELISVIIPAYNAAPYLENCLDSVLGQTYRPMEIILVDDGSTDETLVIADSYRDRYPDMITVIHTENRGVTSARFTGVRASAGEWIGFVDADDEIEPDMYERLHANAVRFNVDISHCGYQTIVNNGERIHYFFNTGRLVCFDKYEGIKELLDGCIELSLCNKLVRRDLIFDIVDRNLVDLSIKYQEDLLVNFFLFTKTENSVFEDFCGYHYLANRSSASRSSFKLEMILDPVRVYRTIIENADPMILDLAWRKYLYSCICAYNGLLGHKGLEEERRKIRSFLINNKDKWSLLTRKEQIKMYGALFFPNLYNSAYWVYSKLSQNKVYE